MYSVFINIALFIGVIPLLLLYYKSTAYLFGKPIVPFVWLTAAASIYEFAGTGILEWNSSYWFQLYTLFEIVTLFLFFSGLLPRQKKILSVLFYATLVIYGISLMFWERENSFIALAIAAPPITLFVLYSAFSWFRAAFAKIASDHLWKASDFFFVSGFSIYYASTFFLYLSANQLVANSTYFRDYWVINVIATLILRILLIIGVWKMK